MNKELSFGAIVRERRHFRDLTQSELARRVGCATITVRKIEAGDLRPSVQIAERLAMALAVPLEERVAFVRLARAALRDTPEPSPLPTPRPAPEEIGEEDLSGRAIRGFQLGERIGKGGFGAVYRAVQPLVERDVAVKIILPEYADHPEFIRRFESEAQLVARLEHPHIVPLYDYWREPGVAYLVMRLIRGGSLSAELRKGPMSLGAAGKLLEQIGSALHLAHRSGVIHRDLKPSNILLDDDNNAYLADFGIAKNLGDPNSEERDGAVVGSPAYLSPEQIRAESVRPETDIYSLGLLTYELLAGSPAFKGPTPVNYRQQQLNEPIPYLSQANPELPAELDLVLSRATAKNPLERYPDVPSFLEGLQGALSAGDGRQPGAELIDIDLAEIENPFKGLRAFGEADADDFFGRDTLIQELLGRMGQAGEPAAGADGDLARFLAVVGPSGSGKSSVVKAGLIPALRRGALPGSERWFIVDMIPGSHPLEELEATLLRVAVNPPERLPDRLRKSERGLLRVVRELLKFDPDAELVLVIDQFEELFTLVEDEDVREHFLNSLVAAVLDPGSRLRLVITLRADFVDRPLGYVDFGELVRRQTEFVLPMTPDELEQAISRPAERHGLVVEPELVATIVRDVGDQPGTLPLLQYALTELFKRRQGRTLTRAAYRESGGVHGALARRAEEIYDELEPGGQSAARQLFLRLLTLGDEVTRRRVLRSELEALNHSQFSVQDSPFTAVIDAYARHRLLTFDRDPLTRAPTVEVAHEALLHEWGRLRGWLDESRDDVRTQRLLGAAAAEWQEAGRDPGFLLHGSRLEQFAGWAERSDLALTADETAFLEASLEARTTRQAEEEARRRRELETARRLAETEAARADEQAQAAESLRRRAIFLAGALVVAAILAVLAIAAGRQSSLNAQEAEENFQLAVTREAVAISAANQRATAQAIAELERLRADEERDAAVDARATAVAEGMRADEERDAAIAAEAEANAARVAAEEQRQIAISRELASAAVANLDKDPERSVLLAMEAFNAAHTQEAEAALHEAVPNLRVLHRLEGHEDRVLSLAYNSDGTRLLTGSRDGTARVWDTESGEELLRLPGHAVDITSAAYSADGTFVVTADRDAGLARVWDATTGELRHSLSGHLNQPNVAFPGEPIAVFGVAISPDSTTIATGGQDGYARLWDSESGEQVGQLTFVGRMIGVLEVHFSPDGSQLLLVSGSPDEKVVQIVDLETGDEVLTLDGVDLAMFTPAGSRVLAGEWVVGDEVSLWDVETGEEVARHYVGEVQPIHFRPDGALYAMGGFDGNATIHDAETGVEVMQLSGHQDILWRAHFSPDGTKLATSSADKTVRIWDLGPSYELLTLEPFVEEADVTVSDIAFRPDGGMLAAGNLTYQGGDSGAISLWDPQTGELILELAGHDNSVNLLAFSPDGSRLASASADMTAKVWDTATGELLQTMRGHENGVLRVAYSPDGSTITTTGEDNLAIVWDATTGEILDQMPTIELGVGIAYSPDGALLAIGEVLEGRITIYDLASGAMVQQFVNGDYADGLFFSADGERLIVGGTLGSVKVWELATAELLQDFEAHQSRTWGYAVSPNEKMIASGATNNLVRLWDLQSGERLLTLEGHTGSISDVEFSPDGRQLVTASYDGTVRFWVLSPEELVSLAESRLTRDLTAAECRQFLHVEECPARP